MSAVKNAVGTESSDVREVRIVHPKDPLAQPLLADLEVEYDRRYGVEIMGETASVELNRYPPERFTAPEGAFLLLLDGNGEAISGGAFMRYDEHSAEFKRIWTRPDARGRGLAAQVLTALEREAQRLGYTRIYLTTGPRQPEAVALYLRTGYTPLFDQTLPSETIGIHPFEKHLTGALAPTEAVSGTDSVAV